MRAEASAEVTTTRRILVLAVVIAAVLAFGLAMGITRAVTSRIVEFLAFVGRVAHGDLTGSVSVHGRDELTVLAVQLNQMAAGLHDLAAEVGQAVTQIGSGAAEIF